MDKIALIGGAVLCFLAVAIGAFGSHALSGLLEMNDRTHVYELANRYQFYHGLGLLVIGGLASSVSIATRVISTLMLLGTLIFSGSLYALALSNLGWLGAITPIGGVLLIAAWGMLIFRLCQFCRALDEF